jgi:hypothetical protein
VGPSIEKAGGGGGERGDAVRGTGRRVVAQEIGAAEAAITLPALGVEDPELCPSARRSMAAPGDERLRSLADDIAAQPDPARPGELEAEPGRLCDRRREAGREARWLECDKKRLRPTGEGRETPQPVRDLRRRRADAGPRRQVDHEDVHRAGRQQHPRDRETLVEGVRGEDDEPIEMDAASHGFDRVECPSEIEPRDDRPVRLGLGDEPKGERGRPRGRRTAHGDARVPRQPTRADDPVELRKASPDDSLDARSRVARGRRTELRGVVERLGGERRGRQCPHHPRSCGTPPRLEGRQSRRHVRGEGRHRTASIEHLFCIVNGCAEAAPATIRPRAAPPRRVPRRSRRAPATGSAGDARPSRRRPP